MLWGYIGQKKSAGEEGEARRGECGARCGGGGGGEGVGARGEEKKYSVQRITGRQSHVARDP